MYLLSCKERYLMVSRKEKNMVKLEKEFRAHSGTIQIEYIGNWSRPRPVCTINFGGGMNGCVLGMGIMYEIHSILLAVDRSLLPAI